MKKLSILGLVLLGVSAVTAAIIPSKKEKKFSNNGIAVNPTNDGTNTCAAPGSATPNCFSTVGEDPTYSVTDDQGVNSGTTVA